MKIGGYEFEEVVRERHTISDKRGVYVILCLVDGEPHCILDIGESSKVGTRLKDHDRKQCWRENVHGEIGFCVKYTSYKGGMENPHKHAPPAARESGGKYPQKERHAIEEELQWKLDYPCGTNPWEKIERAYERYKKYEDEFGPRGSRQL